jgi:hypothetical protein
VIIHFSMSDIRLIFTVFSVLVGLLLLSIWSNAQVNAQQSLASPRAAASLPSTTISPQIKAKMCDPGNPGLKVVNTTEARICGIPKSVKNATTTAATPTASAVPTSSLANNVASSKHQKMSASNNSNTITSTVNQLPKQTSKTIIDGKGTTATLAPVKNVSNKSLSLPSSQSSIAPQVNAINRKQQQQQQQQLLPTVGNVTAGQNHTFTATPTPVIPGKLINQVSSATREHSSSSSKDKHSSGTKPSSTEDSSSSKAHSSRAKSSSQNGDSSKSSSAMKNDILSAIMKGLNNEESYSSGNGENSFAGDNSFDNGGSAASASSSAGGGGKSTASASSTASK